MKVQLRPLSYLVLPCSVICLLETVVKIVETSPVWVPERKAACPRHEKSVVHVLGGCNAPTDIFLGYNYEKYLKMPSESQGPEP